MIFDLGSQGKKSFKIPNEGNVAMSQQSGNGDTRESDEVFSDPVDGNLMFFLLIAVTCTTVWSSLGNKMIRTLV